jgi:hypothetical protein
MRITQNIHTYELNVIGRKLGHQALLTHRHNPTDGCNVIRSSRQEQLQNFRRRWAGPRDARQHRHFRMNGLCEAEKLLEESAEGYRKRRPSVTKNVTRRIPPSATQVNMKRNEQFWTYYVLRMSTVISIINRLYNITFSVIKCTPLSGMSLATQPHIVVSVCAEEHNSLALCFLH